MDWQSGEDSYSEWRWAQTGDSPSGGGGHTPAPTAPGTRFSPEEEQEEPHKPTSVKSEISPPKGCCVFDLHVCENEHLSNVEILKHVI